MSFFIVVLWVLCCFAVAKFGDNKGLSSWQCFFVALVFSPLIGALVVFLSKPKPLVLERRKIKGGLFKKCPFCAELIKNQAIVCMHCGKDIPESTDVIESSNTTSHKSNNQLPIILLVLFILWVLYNIFRH